MTSIGSFIRSLQRRDEVREAIERFDWNSILEDQGYYSVKLIPKNNECWDWCTEKFGIDYYAWTSSKFFFKTEQDAIMFTFRWS
jgi:hypothetical protein